MPARAPRGLLEDSYQRLLLNDFSGGLNTYVGALNLPSNTSPDMFNLVPFPGRLKYRGGSDLYATLTETSDQAFSFYDTAGVKHFPVWRDGDLVDVVNGSEVVIDAAAYTAGDFVGRTELGGVLYWSTALVPLRYWNPATSSVGAVVQTGTSPPPASPYLTMYSGSIVALGVKFGSAAYQSTVFSWSAVNQVGNWDASNSQAVGSLSTSATLSFGIPMGIANTGIPPTRTLIIARSDKGIYAFTGALGSMTENTLNCPTGCKDGASAVFCPGADGFGDVIFLGGDGQIYKTNGVNCVVASLDIQSTLQAQVGNAYLGGNPPRFWAGYNEPWCYYFVNVNGIQFVYKWDIQKWTMFYGWANGPVINSTDADSIPTLFIASCDATNLGFWRIAVPGIGDHVTANRLKGVIPTVYYKTAWLHAGDPELLKIWHFITLMAYNVGTIYSVSARGLMRANDGSYLETDPVYLHTNPLGEDNSQFILNVSVLDGPNVLAAAILGQPVSPVMVRGRFACPVTWEQDSMCRGLMEEIAGGGGKIYEDLKAVAIQICIRYHGGTMDFDVLGLQTRFLERGYRREGGNEYDSESGVPNPHDPFMYSPLLPNDTAESS